MYKLLPFNSGLIICIWFIIYQYNIINIIKLSSKLLFVSVKVICIILRILLPFYIFLPLLFLLLLGMEHFQRYLLIKENKLIIDRFWDVLLGLKI